MNTDQDHRAIDCPFNGRCSDSIISDFEKAGKAQFEKATQRTIMWFHLHYMKGWIYRHEQLPYKESEKSALVPPVFHSPRRMIGIKMNIFIGNLSYNVIEADLHDAFEVYGQVALVRVIKDKHSGRSKGFGFVEMPVKAEAQSAIAALNGKSLNNRTITVNEARPHSGGRRSEGRTGGGDRRGGGRSC